MVALAVLVAGLLAVGTWMTLSALFGRPKECPSQTLAEEGAASTLEPEVVFLSNQPAIEAINWPFRGPIPGPPMPPDQPPSPGGPRVSVQGHVSPHGLFMHLPPQAPQKTEVSYRLDKKYRTFSASVSLNDGPPNCIPLIFAVYGDGKLLWRSTPVTSQQDTQSCKNLSVQGVDKLTLQVSGFGDARGTHAVWIEPSVTTAK